jgi:hypothetical protein
MAIRRLGPAGLSSYCAADDGNENIGPDRLQRAKLRVTASAVETSGARDRDPIGSDVDPLDHQSQDPRLLRRVGSSHTGSRAPSASIISLSSSTGSSAAQSVARDAEPATSSSSGSGPACGRSSATKHPSGYRSRTGRRPSRAPCRSARSVRATCPSGRSSLARRRTRPSR